MTQTPAKTPTPFIQIEAHVSILYDPVERRVTIECRDGRFEAQPVPLSAEMVEEACALLRARLTPYITLRPERAA